MKQKTDWDGLVRMWVTEKTVQPTMDMAMFFRQHGFKTQTQINRARERIGRAMGVAWATVRDKMMTTTVDLAASSLTKVLQRVLAFREQQVEIGAHRIIKQEGKKAAVMGPLDFAEAETTLNHGLSGITDVVRLATGGEPLMTTRPRKLIIDFVPVALYNKPERKKRTKRKG